GERGLAQTTSDAARASVKRDVPNGFRGVDKVAWSPDGRLLAVADDEEVALVETRTWRERFRLVGVGAEITSIAFSPDGKTFAAASLDQTIHMWEIATGRELGSLKGHTAGATTLSFSPDGRTI